MQTCGRARLVGDGRGAPVEEVSPKIIFCQELYVIAYRATLDVPRELAQFAAWAAGRAPPPRHARSEQDAFLLLAGGAGLAVVARPHYRRGAGR